MGFKLSFDLADIHLFKPTCIGKTKIRGRVEKSGGAGGVVWVISEGLAWHYD